MSAPETILQEAQRLVQGDRQAAYTNPHNVFHQLAGVWESRLGLHPGTLDSHKVCLMLIDLKICREWMKPKRDSRVDIAGYALCADMCLEEMGDA